MAFGALVSVVAGGVVDVAEHFVGSVPTEVFAHGEVEHQRVFCVGEVWVVDVFLLPFPCAKCPLREVLGVLCTDCLLKNQEFGVGMECVGAVLAFLAANFAFLLPERSFLAGVECAVPSLVPWTFVVGRVDFEASVGLVVGFPFLLVLVSYN